MNFELKQRLKTGDGALFFILFSITLLIWDLLLGSPLTTLFGKYDTTGLVAHYMEMLRSGPEASDFIYSSTRLGGSVTGPADFPAFLQLLSLFNVHPILAVDLLIVLSQTMVAFFSLTLPLLLLDRHWSQELLSVPLALVAAFIPALGWRIFYGHLNLVWGLLWGLALVYLFIAVLRNRLTVTGILLSVIALVNSLQCINLVQPIIYGFFILLIAAVFAAPELRKTQGKKGALITVMLIILGCVVFSVNHLANVFVFLKQIARNTSEAVIYSYNTQTASDFLSSFFYSTTTVPVDRDDFLLHETNLGYGVLPLILMGLGFLLKKYKLLLLNAALISLGIILSSNLPMLSDGLLTVAPILKSFRCPSRVFFLLTFFQLVCFNHLVFSRKLKLTGKGLLLLFLSLVLAIFVPLSLTVSPDYLLLVLALLVTVSFIRREHGHLIMPLAIGTFIGLNILGFREKIPKDRPDLDSIDNERKFFSLFPKLPKVLLEHAALQVHSNVFGLNQSAAYGFSSVDGYAYPQRRFVELFRQLAPQVPLTQNQFLMNSRSPFFPLFQNLFNITGEVVSDGRTYEYKELRKSTPLHVPTEIRISETSVPMIQEYMRPQGSLRVAFVEPWVGTELKGFTPCQDGHLVEQSELRAVLAVTSPAGKCLLVLPTQYTEFLAASSKERTFPVVPVNQVMTGVVVENFSGSLTLEPKSVLGGERLFRILGFAIILIGFIYGRKKKTLNPN